MACRARNYFQRISCDKSLHFRRMSHSSGANKSAGLIATFISEGSIYRPPLSLNIIYLFPIRSLMSQKPKCTFYFLASSQYFLSSPFRYRKCSSESR